MVGELPLCGLSQKPRIAELQLGSLVISFPVIPRFGGRGRLTTSAPQECSNDGRQDGGQCFEHSWDRLLLHRAAGRTLVSKRGFLSMA